MTSPTQPTVLLLRQIDVDDDDDDDAPPAAVPTIPTTPATTTPTTPSPGPPPAPTIGTAVAVPSSSVTGIADSLPSGAVQDTVVPGNAPANDNQDLSGGAIAGIVVGVVIAVILIVVGGWFFTRRRRSQAQRTRTGSGGSTVRGHTSDEETAKKSEVYAYRAPGAVEISGGQDVSAGGNRRSELASPTVPVEVTGDGNFAVELPGSAVPARMEEK
ncbi:hypothetical protein NX059_004755 [Plenodomus lindquistii]|nr:hypothetical protein NX059_004755 [Plenodomus lindquistii]